MTIQTFDIPLQDLTANEMLVNALTQVAARIDGDIATANSLRANGDAVIAAAMSLIDQRVTVLEQRPDELTEAERQVIEGFLDRLVKQEGFGSLISGLNITIGGVSYSLKGVVESMLAARKIVLIDSSNYVDGIARTIGIQFDGGEALTINATESARTAAELSEIFGRAVANDGIHLQYAGQFGGGTVGMQRIYESVQRTFAGVTVPELRVLRRGTLALSLPGFAVSTPVVLGGLDETGDGVIGVPPAPNLIADLLATLNAAIDAQALADAAVVSAQSAVDAATASSLAVMADAAAATPSAEALVASTQSSYTGAQSAVGIAAAADAAAAADVVAAEQLLADATAAGDQAQIDAATAALTQEQADRALAVQVLADAQSVQAASAQAYTEAVQALNVITSTVSAAAQVQADAQAALSSAQAQATAAAAAVAQAHAAYDAVVPPTPIP